MWVVGYDQYAMQGKVYLQDSTHLLYYKHDTYSLTIEDRIKDEDGNEYDILAIEQVWNMQGNKDHMTAFLSLKQ